MITDQQYTEWLSSADAIRCILVEVVVSVADVETTRYLSSKGFSDVVAGRIYSPVVSGNSVRIVERMSINNNSSISFGDVAIHNIDGSLDSWLDDVWVNRDINVFVGDVRWDRSDFRAVFSGITEDIGSSGNAILNLKVRDKLQRLNTPITEAKLGGTTKNKNELIPLCFGEVHNITPLLTNPATLEYQVHDGPIESIIEVRDNGVPVGFTPTVATGKFTLTASPFGKITASVQGDKPSAWNKTASDIIQRVVTGYGNVENRFSSGDLDLSQLSTFDTANPQPLGIYIKGRENVLSVCRKLAESVGAQLVMTRSGLLQLIKIELPSTGTSRSLGVTEIVKDTLVIRDKIPVMSAQKIGFAKNWTIQDSLETGIPAEHKELFKQEWLTFTQEDVTVKAKYKIDSEPIQIDTALITESDASIEAQRLLDLLKVPRFIYALESTAVASEFNLGDELTLTHPRFELSPGKSGMITGLSINWENLRVNVEVLI